MPDGAHEGFRTVKVRPSESGFGGWIEGVDLARPLPPEALAEVKAAWAKHSVVSFPRQALSLDELEAFTLQIGAFGVDPFIAPMPGHPNVLELRREPDEKATNFGAGWHSDWSFQKEPPAATILHGQVIPPIGGDTLFADCASAYDALSDAMKAVLAPLRAVHSATRAYGTKGVFARETEKRTMEIIVSDEAGTSLTNPPGLHRRHRGLHGEGEPGPAGLPLRPYHAGRVRLPPQMGGRYAADVGQPLHSPLRRGRL